MNTQPKTTAHSACHLIGKKTNNKILGCIFSEKLVLEKPIVKSNFENRYIVKSKNPLNEN